tara:strand:- start:241 stop:678 length:438 start_codon:yes stop_codon:yes gene_type:complete
MANRILLGKDSGGTYCLKVSQPGDNVLSPSEPFLFDSTSARTGMVYAGGNASSTTGINWSATKGQLGFIPLVISTDDNAGSKETYDSGQNVEVYYENGEHFDTTLTSITPRDEDGSGGRTAANLKFMVTRLPMQYGKMNDSSLWT